MMKRHLIIFVCLMPALQSFILDFEKDGIYYKLISQSDKTVEVAYKDDKYTGAVNIPSSVTIDGKNYYTVTGIGSDAFYGCSGLTSITIPNSVKSIGKNAFEGCTGLTSVTIPNSVTDIGNYAFYGCSGLTSVSIPNSVTSIGNNAFYNCSSLSSVTIPNSVTSIGEYVFYNCRSLTSVSIPNSVTSIGKNAFYMCSSLTSVTIPNNVTDIGRSAFYQCSSLTSVSIPNSITSINDYAFAYCSGLTSLSIPSSVKDIGNYAFRNCRSLTSLSIPNSVTSIGNYAFAYCRGLTSVSIPNSVTNIYNGAFDGCEQLTEVFVDMQQPIPIMSNVFSNRTNATLYVPAGSKSAYQAADCWKEFKAIVEGFKVDGIYYSYNSSPAQTVSVTYKGDSYNSYTNEYTGHVTVPSSVTYNGKTYTVTGIGNNAFMSCTGLTSVTIPNSVTAIGNYAFRSCDLYTLKIPNSVTTIGSYAFQGCSNITAVTIPESVTSIGNYAFSSCGLYAVTIPNGVTSIGNGAFSGCKNLSSATIPSSVTTIGVYAFDGCSSLTSVYVGKETPVSISSSVFSNRANATLYVPYGCKSAYSSANYWKDFKSIVEMNYFVVDGICYHVTSSSAQTVEVTNKESASGTTHKYTGSVTIPPSVTFGGKTYSVTKIGESALRTCSGLTSVSIPNTVTTIDSHAFRESKDLTSITIPEGVKYINTGAFDGCSSLTDVIIPSSVTYIGNYAFDYCSSLTSVTVQKETPLSIGSTVFSNRANATLYVPKGSKSAYANANYWKEFKEIVELEIPYVVGDINGDNVVDILDYTGIANYIHGNAPEGFNEQAADVDNNGVIDILDYTGIANIIHTGSIYGNTNNARATGN